ncbi:MAG: S4 domain-containing protein, partial [Spirochaetota bacterium]
MNPHRTPIPIGEHDEGRRLDRVLRHLLPNMPLSRVYSLLRKGAVRVNGRRRNASYRLQHNDVIEIPADLAGGARQAGAADQPGGPEHTGRPGRAERPTEAARPRRAAAASLPPELAQRVVYESEP